MRAYAIDSPQAAARLLAMALVADGHFALSELKALDRLETPQRLGISPAEMAAVIDTFCEDLQAIQRSSWGGSAHLDPLVRQHLLSEVRGAQRRAEVQALCAALVSADGCVSDGESELMDANAAAWQPFSAPSPARVGVHA
ncbi:MAG: TerB family tellurite resistance protein [Hydrogenophaga sp.]